MPEPNDELDGEDGTDWVFGGAFSVVDGSFVFNGQLVDALRARDDGVVGALEREAPDVRLEISRVR